VTYSSARKSLAVLTCLGLLAMVVAGCSSPGGTSAGKAANVGESVTVDNLKYTVTAVTQAKKVGPSGNSFTMKDGDFVVLDMEVQNTGDKATDFDGEMAKVYDVDSQLYELNLEAAAASCKADEAKGYKNVWFGSLQPGEKTKTKAVFDIPNGIKGLKVELRSADIGSTNTAVVSLGI
jgi:hypothetical protein